MRSFDFEKDYDSLLSPITVGYLTRIHEYKGMFSQVELQEDVRADLLEASKIQSIGASNRIEGIKTTDERLRMLVREKTMPETRSEKEIAGYRDVLSVIHENYKYIPISTNLVQQLHRDLYRFSPEEGGQFKTADNVITETLPDRSVKIRFEPLSAWETPDAMDALCRAYNAAVRKGTMDPLLLIPVFIMHFLCIHPFNDGNGRMSRLLTLLTLYRASHVVGRYISIEKLINDTSETYYEAIEASSIGWNDGTYDMKPFVEYMLNIILTACREYADRLRVLTDRGLSKIDRVREEIRNNYGKITKTELLDRCPGISQTTVQRALNELHRNDFIVKIGGGRYTSYAWNHEKESTETERKH